MTLSTLTALEDALHHPGPATVHLTYADPSLRTALQVQGGAVVGLKSAVVPLWSTTLLAAGVHPEAIARAQQRSTDLPSALAFLQALGLVTAPELAALARDRLVGALLPLAWQAPLAVEVQSRPGLQAGVTADPFGAVQETAQLAALFTPREKALRVSDRFVASTVLFPQGSPDPVLGDAYQALVSGLTLGEVAQRLPLRWDRLVLYVAGLMGQGVLRRDAEGWTTQRQPARLTVGEEAPDFLLPDLSGGRVRLSGLRGSRVWLVFGRQATCALCNPRHAQIIGMQPGLKARGVETVSVWGSSLIDLEAGIGRMRPPYPVLADPEDVTFERYGLSFSVQGTLDARSFRTLVQGFRMMGLDALNSDGELFRMPAEFLIGPDGRIEHAHYNALGADWMPVETLLAWAR